MNKLVFSEQVEEDYKPIIFDQVSFEVDNNTLYYRIELNGVVRCTLALIEYLDTVKQRIIWAIENADTWELDDIELSIYNKIITILNNI